MNRYHSTEFYDPKHRKKILTKLVRLIRSKELEFEAVAFCGISGALMAPVVADRLDKKLLAIRKDREKEVAHSWSKIEGLGRKRYVRYILIDDFIETGGTCRRVHQVMGEHDLVAIFLYAGNNGSVSLLDSNCFPVYELNGIDSKINIPPNNG